MVEVLTNDGELSSIISEVTGMSKKGERVYEAAGLHYTFWSLPDVSGVEERRTDAVGVPALEWYICRH